MGNVLRSFNKKKLGTKRFWQIIAIVTVNVYAITVWICIPNMWDTTSIVYHSGAAFFIAPAIMVLAPELVMLTFFAILLFALRAED